MKHLLTIFLLLICHIAHAELSKWVDAEGKVHYSDEAPPANVKVKPLNIPKEHAPFASATPATKSLAELEAELRKKQKAKEAATQKAIQQQEEARAKQQNCDIARSNLRVLEDSPRIATYGSNGERSYLDDAARKQRIEEARKVVSQHCD